MENPYSRLEYKDALRDQQVILLLIEPINEKISYHFLPMWQLCFYQLVLKEYEQCYWVLLINMKYITNTNILTYVI